MKDKKKTKTIPRQVRWDKLDNTAHLFPSIAGESMTNVYRISVTLKEEVQVEFLQQALDMILPKFDGFNLRMRTGVFWYYFEENGKKAPKVTEEAMFPCRFIRQNKNRNYLFRVTYYKSRINLEVFHVLTDGMGGINFLRELTYQYLRLVHPELAEKEGNKLSGDTSLSREDSFVRNYRSSKPSGFNKEKAYLIKEDKLPAGEFGVMHGRMPVSQLKKVAHGYHASLNEYLYGVCIKNCYTGCREENRSESQCRSICGRILIRIRQKTFLLWYLQNSVHRKSPTRLRKYLHAYKAACTPRSIRNI